MKKFNLDEYLANPSKKVVTREGRNARIVCTDFKTKHNSVLALVDYGKYECTISCTKEGRHCYGIRESANDLFFAPEKKEGWANIYLCEGEYSLDDVIYSSRIDAEESGKKFEDYLTTIQIEWEE